MIKKITITIIFLIFISSNMLYAQDLTHFFDRFKQKPSINGNVNVSQFFYNVYGIQPRQDPYTYYINLSLNFNIFGWNIPFALNFSNNQLQTIYPTFRILPYNQYGFSPSYRWAKLHLGYRTMSFSPYVMQGRTFYGIGLELTPGIFDFAFMYGKLQQATEADSLNLLPSFKRIGWAMKFGLKSKEDYVNIILFYAKDDTSSINYKLYYPELLPRENLVYNFNLGKRIYKKIYFTVNYATSALTNDYTTENYNGPIPAIFNFSSFLFPNKVSTIYRRSYKSSLKYNLKTLSLGISFEHIDPEYQSLGLYFINNDLENYTFDVSTKLFKNKLRVKSKFGLQRNNLDNNKLSRNKKFVASFSTNYIPSYKYSFSFNYSNFSSYVYLRTIFEEAEQTDPLATLDTLNFVQINQNASVRFTYSLTGLEQKNIRKLVNIFINYQNIKQQMFLNNVDLGSDFVAGNISYTQINIPKNFNFTTSLTFNYTGLSDKTNFILGPALTAGKKFFKRKLTLNATSSYMVNFFNDDISKHLINIKVASRYKLKKHSLGFNLIFLRRISVYDTENNPTFSEFRGNLVYNYNF